VPQFILEDAIHANKGAKCSVVVTQPRRLSAMAVAERVAAERGEKIGATVGYSIRLESKVSKDTRLLFCTTGILLRRLQSDPDLSDVTHVVVDEVHERDLLSDFLLVILRSLATRRRDFRLVAMSATVDAELFQRYFEAEVPGTCGCIEIPGRTFPVAEYRLEDAIEATGYVVDPEGEYAAGSEANFNSKSVAGGSRRTFNPLSGGVGGAFGGASSRAAKASRAAKESLERTSLMDDVTEETRASYPGYSEATLRCLQTVDEEKINLELIEALVALIADEYEDGAILIFLPGMAEIRALHERLLAELEDVENRFALVPLHSTLSSEEQRLTFSKPPPGVRKVVMATNIAETSVTIDDVVFVIDAGRVRETRYDPVTRMSSLVTAWCSRASGRQRRGRAGRVREGYCFHLYSSRKEKTLADFATPEISRVPLDALCLQIKILKLGDVRAFLRRAIEPPNETAVAAALRSLQELDAVDHADELTPLGHHLAELPVDARLGKMMLYGAMFSCLDPVLTIAAGVGFRSPFLAPMDRRDEADEAKRRIAEKAGAAATSDHLTLVAAYAGWIRAKARGKTHERAFLSSAFLSAQTLRQISEMRQQYVELLDQIGFLRSGAGLFETASGSKQTEPATMEASVSAREGEGSGLSAAAPPFVFAPPSLGRDKTDGSGKKQKRKQNSSRLTELRAALAAASVNASNEPLVRAVICAGLYPNVALAENAQGPNSGGASERDTKSAARMNSRDRFAAAAKARSEPSATGSFRCTPRRWCSALKLPTSRNGSCCSTRR
jgi:ATP-dependent RNA helicase DHX36